MKQLYLITLLALVSSPAMAYVGPGLGMGVIGTIFGVLAAILLALFGLFWYPLKRALKKKQSNTDSSQGVSATAEQPNAINELPANSQDPLNTRADELVDELPGQTGEPASAKRTENQMQ